MALLLLKPWEIFGSKDDTLKGHIIKFYGNAAMERSRPKPYIGKLITILRSQKLPKGKVKIWYEVTEEESATTGMVGVFKSEKVGYVLSTTKDGALYSSILAPINSHMSLC